MQTFIANTSSIAVMLQTVIALVVIAVFVMAIVSFVMAIWDFIRSEGEEEAKKKGWNRIRFMMIWVVLTILFLILFPLLMRQLWIMNYEMFTAPNIFNRVGEIMNYLLTMGTHVNQFYTSGGGNVFTSESNTVQNYTL